MIHMKCQTLFSLKKKIKERKKIKMSSDAVVISTLRVNCVSVDENLQ